MSMSVSMAADQSTVKPQRGVNNSSTALSSGIDYPVLRTRRFQFRPFVLADIAHLATLANEHRVADSAVGVPHPCTVEFARMCVSSNPNAWANPQALHWAAVEIGEQRIRGYAGLDKIDIERSQVELRFWVGCGVARNGYAAEWCAAILEFAMTHLGMNRIYALQLERHPLAGRVLAALGMQQEAHLRKRIYREGMLEDVTCWAIVRDEH